MSLPQGQHWYGLSMPLYVQVHLGSHLWYSHNNPWLLFGYFQMICVTWDHNPSNLFLELLVSCSTVRVSLLPFISLLYGLIAQIICFWALLGVHGQVYLPIQFRFPKSFRNSRSYPRVILDPTISIDHVCFLSGS